MTGTPDENDLRHALHHLVDQEPDSGLAVDRVVTEGRRLRRRHRARVLAPAAALGVVAIAGATAIVVSDSGTESPAVTTVAAAQPFSSTAPVTGTVTDPRKVSSRTTTLLSALRASSPDGWRFTVDGSYDGVPSIDGTVDDGDGEPGRISVSSTNTPGMLTVHPCTDSEYRQGGTCTETTLPDGSFLSVRGVVDYKGIRTIVANVTHADGTGTFAEAGNFTLPPQPASGQLVSKKDKIERYGPVISRDDPVYSTGQLVAVVKAVEKATDGWKTDAYRPGGR